MTARSRSRRTGGRPGESITARPVNAAAQPGGRPIESTSIVEVLRPPVEPGQYTARVQARADAGICWDNGGAESLWWTFQHENYDRNAVATKAEFVAAVGTLMDFYHTHGRHSVIGMLSPMAYQQSLDEATQAA